MPPFVGRKRSTPPPPSRTPAKKVKLTKNDAATAAPHPTKKASGFSLSSDSESSLTDIESDEFEDVPRITVAKGKQPAVASDDDDDDEDEDVEWEDAPVHQAAPDFSNREFKDLKIAVREENELDYGLTAQSSNAKKGPSKREKAIRMNTHKMHVQLLLWHNAKRNRWINDKKVHEILLKQLPSQIVREIDKWKRASGLAPPLDAPPSSSKDKKKKKNSKKEQARSQRDWGQSSQRLEPDKPNMSSGDPIISLLKVLAAYWKKRFAITAPGLRKRGYGTKLGLRQEIESYRRDKHHPAKHGEKIESLDAFRRLAEKCEGSRDLGAQLFVALLRAIGIESRMVASLQPMGFGFTKAEEMVPRKVVIPQSSSFSESNDDDSKVKEANRPVEKQKRGRPAKEAKPQRLRGDKAAPIDLDSDINDSEDSEDDSVLDVTPAVLKARPAQYDRDLVFPIYWAEAISPITAKVYPVSPLVLDNPVATSPEILSTFEPKGAKAEKAQQVIAYVVAFSSDNSGKDVTVRYLRKRLWPGKTKGFRVPVEKVPIYDARGKVRRYGEYDWFKHCMSYYCRTDDKRTAVDDVEDALDLVIAEPEKKEVEGDTLQSLKASADFVLERHLRREEALKPDAKPVRYFTTGKGENQQQEPVYRRADVYSCLSAESWHKEGRAPKEGEVPMKLVPVRAVTLARKREAEEHLIRTGEKQMQGLYSREQTDWIIPPPIKDGKIPKNAYGNIDCFVPSMVPKGAVHLPLRGTVRICKKLEIDFAEAVVGFEFGNKMAVPIILGVVVAKENEQVVRDAWRAWNDEQRKKEESKMEKLVLEMWRKFVLGLRIRDRVQEDYGMNLDAVQLTNGATEDRPIHIDDDELPGGFMPSHNDDELGGGFLVEHEDDVARGGDLILEREEVAEKVVGYPTPVSREDGRSSELVDVASISKSKLKSMELVSASNSESEAEGDDLPAKESSPPKRGRGRPRKSEPSQRSAAKAKPRKRSLRNESTLVPSRYFD